MFSLNIYVKRPWLSHDLAILKWTSQVASWTHLALSRQHALQPLSVRSRGHSAPGTGRERFFPLHLHPSNYHKWARLQREIGNKVRKRWATGEPLIHAASHRGNTARRLQTAAVIDFVLRPLSFSPTLFQQLARIPADSVHLFAVCSPMCLKQRHFTGKLVLNPKCEFGFWIGKQENAWRLLSDVYFHQIKRRRKWKDLFKFPESGAAWGTFLSLVFLTREALKAQVNTPQYQRLLSSASDPFHPVSTEAQGADFTLRR